MRGKSQRFLIQLTATVVSVAVFCCQVGWASPGMGVTEVFQRPVTVTEVSAGVVSYRDPSRGAEGEAIRVSEEKFADFDTFCHNQLKTNKVYFFAGTTVSGESAKGKLGSSLDI